MADSKSGLAGVALTKEGMMVPTPAWNPPAGAGEAGRVSVLDLLRGEEAPLSSIAAIIPLDASPVGLIDLLHEAGEMSDVQNRANYSVRRMCNVIKMLSPVLAEQLRSGVLDEFAALEKIEVATQMTQRLLQSFSAQTETSCPATLRFQLAQTAANLVAGIPDMSDVDVPRLTQLLVDVARTDMPAPEVPFSVIADNDRALQVTLVNAMTPVLLAVEDFSFFCSPLESLQHAQRQIVSAALQSHGELFPDAADQDASRILTQNLISNYAKIYAKAWEGESRRLLQQYEGLGEEERKALVAAIQEVTPFAGVDAAFQRGVEAMLRLQAEVPLMLDQTANVDAPSVKRRKP